MNRFAVISLAIIAGAQSTVFAQAAGAAPSGGNPLVTMLPMMVMVIGVMYFMVIRPQQKRMKEHKKLLETVQRGDDVTVSGGMRGKVYEVKDGTVLVDIGAGSSKNIVVEFDKASIQAIRKASA